MTQNAIDEGAAAIRARLGDAFPKTAIILGSGIGKFADRLTDAKSISYADIPGFSASTVLGHAGRLMTGKIGALPLAIMAGRIHIYEGHPAQAIALPIRILRKLGVERLILTNASGGLTPEMVAGWPKRPSGLASWARVIAPQTRPASPDAAMVTPPASTLSR